MEKNKISYCVTVADELEEFVKLINFLNNNKRKEDNILILIDLNKCGPELENSILEYSSIYNIIACFDYFQGDFASWKNKFWTIEELNENLNDYLFFLDADELPNPELIEQIPYIIEINPDVDIFGLPRANFVEGITDDYIKQVGWRKDSQNRINYGDYQYRICKNNPQLRWVGKVHESIQGYKLRVELPMNDVYDLLHIKTFEKQQKQNNFYNSL